MNKDLTKGKPSSVLFRFCLPLLGSVLFQQLYNIADSLVAGKFIGDDALAAVGNSYEITLIFIAFAFGCNIGCSVMAANLFGAGRRGELKTAVATAMTATAAVCLVLMAFGFAGGGALLRLIRTPESIFADSKRYLYIYILGLPFMFLYQVSTGVFSALGDSRTPFLFLAGSSLSNIALDMLFVAVFGMGVEGVAWATFLCQGVSCGLALAVVLRRLNGFVAGQKTALFSRIYLRRFATVAVPSILQQSFISVGNIVIQGVINGFGTAVIAGYSAAVKLNNMVITSLTAVGNGISSYTAQNIGAEAFDRVKGGFRAALRLVWGLCLPIVLLYLFGGRWLLGLFLKDPSGAAMDTGMAFLRTLAPFYFVVAAKLAADGILRGAGMMGRFMIATFVDLILRVVLAVVLSRTPLETTGIWMAWPIGWTVATLLSISFYAGEGWRRRAEQTLSD